MMLALPDAYVWSGPKGLSLQICSLNAHAMARHTLGTKATDQIQLTAEDLDDPNGIVAVLEAAGLRVQVR